MWGTFITTIMPTKCNGVGWIHGAEGSPVMVSGKYGNCNPESSWAIVIFSKRKYRAVWPKRQRV